MKACLASLLIAVLLPALSPPAFGGSGGSGYSRYGIGDIRYFAGSRSAALGGTTIALMSPTSLNRLNPAGQTKLLRTHFTGTFSYEGFRTTDGSQSAFLSTGTFGGAFLALPLSIDDGLTFSAGFNPYSTVNYKIRTEHTLGSENYSNLYSGEGGLSTAVLGFSLTPLDSLNLGLRLNYLSGQLRIGSDVTFTSTELAAAKYRRTVKANGFGLTLGFIYTGLGRVTGLKSLDGLNVGAIFSTATDLNATQENINISPVGEDTIATKEGKIRIPVSAGFGIAWLLGEKYLVAGDIFHQQWSDFRFYDVHPPQIRNSTRISLGLEIQPSMEVGGSYWKKVAYRFGAYYLSSYYQIGTEPINEVALTTGLGLPIGADTRLELALEYGRRGTTDQQLLRDNILRFSVTLNVGEKWFVRVEEE